MREEVLVDIVGPGAALIVGYVGGDGAPVATRGWSVTTVDANRARVRIIVEDDGSGVDERMIGTRLGVTGADVATYRAQQMKGEVVVVERPSDGDRANAAEHARRFFEAVHASDGNPLWLVERMWTDDLVAVEIIIDEIYDQTPGPGAGGAIELHR